MSGQTPSRKRKNTKDSVGISTIQGLSPYARRMTVTDISIDRCASHRQATHVGFWNGGLRCARGQPRAPESPAGPASLVTEWEKAHEARGNG